METLRTILMIGHIVAGSFVLLSMVSSIVTKLADLDHSWHIYGGRIFTLGMTLIFVTGMGLSFIRTPINWFMVFVSLFSFYFALMGWRYAVNRKGTPTALEKWVPLISLPIFIGFVAAGVYWMVQGQGLAIVAIIFGIIGLFNANTDRKNISSGGLKGKERVAQHLSRMLGASIAAATAFFVINVDLNNQTMALIAWLSPTIVLTPIMVIWEKRIMEGTRRKGMAS